MLSWDSYVPVQLLYRFLPSLTISRASSSLVSLVPAKVNEDQSGSHVLGNKEMKRSDSVAVLIVGTLPIRFGGNPKGSFRRIERQPDFLYAVLASRFALGPQFLEIGLGLHEDPLGLPFSCTTLRNRIPVVYPCSVGPVLSPRTLKDGILFEKIQTFPFRVVPRIVWFKSEVEPPPRFLPPPPPSPLFFS